MTKIEPRKIVPIAAKISAGKSFLLNVIYNIDFLECKAGIGTKFINIIRYNPNLDQPCFYHLTIEKTEENYIFKKDPKYKTKFREKNIINENKKINQELSKLSSSEIDYQEIFYMTELNEVEFIKDKKYLLTHDLCDVPGLSEFQGEKANENKKLVDFNEFEKKAIKGAEEFGLIYESPQNLIQSEQKKEEKEQDDIYYEVDIENGKTYLTEVFKIIKNYIDGLIIVLSIENYYHEENFEIIAKLRKVVNKEIKNCLIILNKIDLSPSPIDDFNKCKGLFMQKFPKCKTFNLNLNTFIPLSAIKLQNELLMKKSFIYLLKYHFYNYLDIIRNEKISTGKSFIDHLTNIIFHGENGITNEKIKEQVDKLNKTESINIINDQIKNVIEELKDKYKEDNNIIFGIKAEDLNNNENKKKDDDDDEDDDDLDDDDDSQVKPSYIIKMVYILYKEKKLIPPISKESNEMLNYFSVENSIINKSNNEIKENGKSGNLELIKLNNDLINEFELFGKEIVNIKTGDHKFKNLTNEIANFIHFLKIYNVIFIPFLGPSNAGKSTIINGIIGKDILPTRLNECTKRGIVIGYSKTDDIYMYKANFKESQDFLGETNYYFSVGNNNLIANGEEEVKNTLTNLNYEFNNKEEDSFYYIETKIKLFDDIKLSDSLKEMIYLIDFPGFGTGNIFEKKRIYNKVMSICHSFIFVVRNSVIKDNSCQNALKDIFEQAQIQKKKFASQFIKSCLFILNNDREQTTTEDDLNIVKNDIQKMLNLKLDDPNDLKLCFFNAKYYNSYCNQYNYFYDIDSLFKKELDKYNSNKSSLYKNPFSFIKSKNQNNFFNFCYNDLKEKTKNLYDINNLNIKNQEINKNIEKSLQTNLIEINKYEKLDEKKILEYEKKFLKLISFGQNKLSELKTLKESNIENFLDIFQSIINYINSIKQEDLGNETENVISLLDMFFQRDFNERKKDLKEIQNLYNEINKESENIIQSNEKIQESILKIKNNYRSKIKNSLLSNKEKLEEELKSKNYENILEEINKELYGNLKGLDKEINEYIKFNEEQIAKLLEIEINIIKKFSLNKYFFHFEKQNFSIYMAKKLGNSKKDFEKQLLDELKNSCESSLSILFKKGIKDFFDSLFSDLTYLENILDILIDTSLKKINFIFELIKEESIHYLQKNFNFIQLLAKAASLEFNGEQKKKWENLCKFYEKTRKKLTNIKNEILNIVDNKDIENNNK